MGMPRMNTGTLDGLTFTALDFDRRNPGYNLTPLSFSTLATGPLVQNNQPFLQTFATVINITAGRYCKNCGHNMRGKVLLQQFSALVQVKSSITTSPTAGAVAANTVLIARIHAFTVHAPPLMVEYYRLATLPQLTGQGQAESVLRGRSLALHKTGFKKTGGDGFKDFFFPAHGLKVSRKLEITETVGGKLFKAGGNVRGGGSRRISYIIKRIYDAGAGCVSLKRNMETITEGQRQAGKRHQVKRPGRMIKACQGFEV